jgi:hypothetical protein
MQNTSGSTSLWRHLAQLVCRYFVAIILLGYASAKLLETQFFQSPSVLDTPVRRLSGLELTWAFYGASYFYGVILAGTQILGALLLFFRPTVRIGVLVLLPVLSNIVLIDFFFSIDGALGMALLLTAMCVFLLLNDAPNFLAYLRAPFAVEAPAISKWRPRLRWPKYLLVAAALLGPFALLHEVRNRIHPLSSLTGMWQFKDHREWSKLYLNEGADCLLRPHSEALYTSGTCKVDEEQKTFQFVSGKRSKAPFEFTGTYQMTENNLTLIDSTRTFELTRIDPEIKFQYVIP